jgi:hypothetical protein
MQCNCAEFHVVIGMLSVVMLDVIVLNVVAPFQGISVLKTYSTCR